MRFSKSLSLGLLLCVQQGRSLGLLVGSWNLRQCATAPGADSASTPSLQHIAGLPE